MTREATRQVIDETGAIHRLKRRIGRGGQGDVWLADGGRRIVKLMRHGRRAETLRRQLIFVRRLDLKGLHVARPIAVLRRPHIGYVAEFLEDMTSIKELIEAPAEGLLEWHIATGGLRRRLRLLAHAGEAIRGLHARGVIYADVSHNNVFVSAPIHADEAWLIDLDNLAHESDPRHPVHTPGYGAPEVVRGTSGCTSLSDAWAFAVLVWQTLTLTHPFVGDIVDEGPPELEEKAFAAELPWAWHSVDDSNACSVGLPYELVMGSRLFELARRCFEHGVDDRSARPSISQWVERLHSAADLTLECPECKGTFLVTETSCPWCDEPSAKIDRVAIIRWVPEQGIVVPATRLPQLPVVDVQWTRLPKRLTEGLQGVAGRARHVGVRRVPRGFEVLAAPGERAWIVEQPLVDLEEGESLRAEVRAEGDDFEIEFRVHRRSQAHTNVEPRCFVRPVHRVEGRARTVLEKGWLVLFDSPDRPQRAAVLGRRP